MNYEGEKSFHCPIGADRIFMLIHLLNLESNKVSLSAMAWKRHTCLLCGAEFRYRITRTKSAASASQLKANAKVQASLRNMIKTESDRRPCPHCGLIQTQMTGQSKVRWHCAVTAVVLLFSLVLIPFYLSHEATIPDLSRSAGVVSGIATILHLLVFLYNPNRNLAANKAAAESDCTKGVTQLIAPGVRDFPGDVPGSRVGLLPVAVLLASSVPFFLSAELLRTRSGWPVNPDWFPAVAGAGDVTRVYVRRMASVRGRWYAHPTVSVRNAAELGLNQKGLEPFKGSSKSGYWGGSFTFPVNKNPLKAVFLYCDVIVPKAPDQAGKTAQLDIALEVFSPQVIEGCGASRDTRDVISQRDPYPLMLASPGAGAKYEAYWIYGAVTAALAHLIAGAILIIKAWRLYHGEPAKVQEFQYGTTMRRPLKKPVSGA